MKLTFNPTERNISIAALFLTCSLLVSTVIGSIGVGFLYGAAIGCFVFSIALLLLAVLFCFLFLYDFRG